MPYHVFEQQLAASLDVATRSNLRVSRVYDTKYVTSCLKESNRRMIVCDKRRGVHIPVDCNYFESLENHLILCSWNVDMKIILLSIDNNMALKRGLKWFSNSNRK